jgi:hypothetical protein
MTQLGFISDLYGIENADSENNENPKAEQSVFARILNADLPW